MITIQNRNPQKLPSFLQVKSTRFDPTAQYAVSGGRSVLALEQEYDRDQMWLDFDTVFIFKCHEKPKANTNPKKPSRKRQRSERIRVQTPMYVYGSREPQLVIPFVEHRRVSANNIKKLIHSDFPGWERFEGKICAFPYNTGDHNALAAWCDANCQKRYGFNKNMAYFESSDEACIARVAYGC